MKLTPVTPSPTLKNIYVISVKIEHGDADFSETLNWKYKTKEEFERDMKLLKDRPDLAEAAGGEEYRPYLEEHFPDAIPHDRVYESADVLATIDHVTGFYYDENGNKFEVTIN